MGSGATCLTKVLALDKLLTERHRGAIRRRVTSWAVVFGNIRIVRRLGSNVKLHAVNMQVTSVAPRADITKDSSDHLTRVAVLKSNWQFGNTQAHHGFGRLVEGLLVCGVASVTRRIDLKSTTF